jgi:uncharacterized protein (DUF302 family)
MIEYGFVRTLDRGFEEARSAVEKELKKEGFGILTEIDVQATLKKKLDVDFRKYVILGACNPPFAHKALQTEENIGLMLPCNVVLYEKEGGDVDTVTEVAVIRPTAAMGMIDNEELLSIALEIEQKLQNVLAGL